MQISRTYRVRNLDGHCPLSMGLGAGLGVAAGWARARLGVLGVQAGAGARAWRARHSAQGAAAGWGAGQRARR